MPVVSFDNVTLRAGSRRVFVNFTWKMERDEHWGVSGPAGSGKSLLAQALCRRLPLVAGRILFAFDGMPRPWLNPGEAALVSTEGQRALLQHYGSCHQSRWMSLEEEAPTVAALLAPESILHRSPYVVRAEDGREEACRIRSAEAVGLIGIAHLLGRRVIQLSNGEARKVLLARALAAGPRLLVLDDPFGGLDPEARAHLAAVLETLHARDDMRIITLTAREEELPAGTTHLLRLEECRAVASGRLAAVRTQAAVAAATPAPAAGKAFPLAGWREAPAVVPLLELGAVSVTYGAARILDHISWTMRSGEHWALLGPNGAGKSTLLSLFLGDNPQVYANEVRVFGIRRGSGENVADLKARIGWMSPELQAWYDNAVPCRDVVRSGFFDSVGLYGRCTEEQERLVRDWMEALGITPLAERPLGALSAGEQRLALLARALVKSPAVLVLDEPAQGLNAAHRRLITGLLDRLCHETPVSLLVVTHHPEELPAAITHLLRMEQGRIVQSGPRVP